MKKIKIIFSILILIALFSSCEKEYPKDIPDWLQTKIDSIIENTDSYGCSTYGDCLIIEEYVYDNKKLYIEKAHYHLFEGATRNKILNSEGLEECVITAIDEESWPDTCGTITNLKSYEYVRTIWQEKP